MTLPNPPLSPIGIFDSGFGGLTVMKAVLELMPHEQIVYFGDTARLPYGSKSRETILRYSLESASFLATQGIKLLVVACNTACCAALEEIRSQLPIPVIGIVEQGVEEVLRLFPKSRVGILGTRATIGSNLYQQRLLSRSPSIQLFPISCPLFVPLVEEGYLDHPLSQLAAHDYLIPLKHQEIEAVLLGCTHYPLLSSVIQKTLGAFVTLIDPAIACAKQVQAVLKTLELLNPGTTPPQHQFFASDDPEKFRALGQAFLNYPIPHVIRKTPDYLPYELQKTFTAG